MKTLEKSIVQFTGNTSPFSDPLLQTQIEFLRHLPESESVDAPERCYENENIRRFEPDRLMVGGSDGKLNGGGVFIPHAVVVACLHEKQPRLLVIWRKYDLSFDAPRWRSD